MRHITVRDEKMAAARRRLNVAAAELQKSLATGSDKEKRAARREHKAAVDGWEAACLTAQEHYCGPCGTTHPMKTPPEGTPLAATLLAATLLAAGTTNGYGILVLKRAIAPDGTEFERSHDLHIVLCEAEWKRLRIQDLIARQLEREKE
jgi:hypothetical protein